LIADNARVVEGLLRYAQMPGNAPGGANTFFWFVRRKYSKKRRPCCLRPFELRVAKLKRATCGARAWAAPRNSLRATRCVQTDAVS